MVWAQKTGGFCGLLGHICSPDPAFTFTLGMLCHNGDHWHLGTAIFQLPPDAGVCTTVEGLQSCYPTLSQSCGPTMEPGCLSAEPQRGAWYLGWSRSKRKTAHDSGHVESRNYSFGRYSTTFARSIPNQTLRASLSLQQQPMSCPISASPACMYRERERPM